MNRLGISVEPIGPDAAAELQLPADTRGLIVTDVTPGGPAWEVLFDDPQRGGPDIIIRSRTRSSAPRPTCARRSSQKSRAAS